MDRKRRKYWEKKIYCEFGYQVGYLLGYIYLYQNYYRDCCTFTCWIANKDHSPMLISSYEKAYEILSNRNYETNFR